VIILWIDYVSPYAFVAKAGAYALEANYEVELQWRPYTLDVASFMGPVEERDPHHWRRVRYCCHVRCTSAARLHHGLDRITRVCGIARRGSRTRRRAFDSSDR